MDMSLSFSFAVSDSLTLYFQVSVSCGIPDFRSKDGIYSRLAVEYPDLPDPQAMFDISYFKRNQGPFFKFAKVRSFSQARPRSWQCRKKYFEPNGLIRQN